MSPFLVTKMVPCLAKTSSACWSCVIDSMRSVVSIDFRCETGSLRTSSLQPKILLRRDLCFWTGRPVLGKAIDFSVRNRPALAPRTSSMALQEIPGKRHFPRRVATPAPGSESRNSPTPLALPLPISPASVPGYLRSMSPTVAMSPRRAPGSNSPSTSPGLQDQEPIGTQRPSLRSPQESARLARFSRWEM